jgi:hypothetical protein
MQPGRLATFRRNFLPPPGLFPSLAISIFAEKALIFYCIAFFVTLFAHRSDCSKASAPPGTASRSTVPFDERLGDIIGDECKIKQIMLNQFNLRRNPAFPLN